MNVIKADLARPILLGRQGEHGATRVVFDLSGYIKTYGDGVAQLAVKRPGDPLEYAAVLTQVDDKAMWEIGPEWTEFAGQGYCYLHWFVDDDHAKSDTFKTLVRESKSACVDAPEPQVGYLDQVLSTGVKAGKAAETAEKSAAEAKATAKRFDETFAGVVQEAVKNAQKSAGDADTSRKKAEQAAAKAEGYTSHPPIIGENGNWWEWDGDTYADTGKPSRGEKGETGGIGPVGPQGVQGEKGEKSVVVVAVVDDDVLRLSEVGSSEIVAKVENDVLHINKEVRV